MSNSQNLNFVSHNLYIGDYLSSINLSTLLQYNITHILVCGKELSCKFPDSINYKYLEIEDVTTYPIKDHFEEAYLFILRGTRKGRVLVHCAQAISRSATIVICFLMKSQKIRFQKAFDLLKKRHPQACPNSGFRKQLEEYEKEIGVGGCISGIF